MPEINWTQVVAQAISTALLVPVTTITTFLVMRYFPKFWEQVEGKLELLVIKKKDKETK